MAWKGTSWFIIQRRKKRVLKKPNDNLWEGISGASKIYCAGEVRKKYGILFLKNVGNFFTYGPSKRIWRSFRFGTVVRSQGNVLKSQKNAQLTLWQQWLDSPIAGVSPNKFKLIRTSERCFGPSDYRQWYSSKHSYIMTYCWFRM